MQYTIVLPFPFFPQKSNGFPKGKIETFGIFPHMGQGFPDFPKFPQTLLPLLFYYLYIYYIYFILRQLHLTGKELIHESTI